jgi:hypothetical protein
MIKKTRSSGLEAARTRGRAVIAEWCRDGTLIDAAEAARQRGTAVAEIDAESLIVVTHGGTSYFLACTMDLPREEVVRVNRALAGCRPSEKVIFWLREHGALRGSTPAQALLSGRHESVVQIAEAWATERAPPGGRL